jgi:hypothetical protein
MHYILQHLLHVQRSKFIFSLAAITTLDNIQNTYSVIFNHDMLCLFVEILFYHVIRKYMD